jgi:hypothetical protein
LNDHNAFNLPLTINKKVPRDGSNYTPIIIIDVWSDSRDHLLAFDEDKLIDADLG